MGGEIGRGVGGADVGERGVIGNVVWVNTVRLMNSLCECYYAAGVVFTDWSHRLGLERKFYGSSCPFLVRCCIYSFLVFLFSVRFFC